ncbi:hypothetical protein Tco_1113877 [Tanacetum coccineum]|uniref:Uncharacterized protein n=1 Tax=Tanacetum coccineum TaxID=301880 RepID=A0ABQ5IX52_9ASTR
MTHPQPKRSFVPQAVLTKSEKLSTAGAAVNTVRLVNTANTKAVNTVRSVNTAASKPIVNHPRTKTNAFKRGYLQSSRPFNIHYANRSSIINANVNTARIKNTTARDKAVVGDEAVHKELGDRMERAATTASSFEAEQDSGSGPRCQDTILGDVDAQTWFETTSKQFNDPPLSKFNIFRSGEDYMQLMKLMAHYTKLSEFVRKKNREKCHIYYAITECSTLYLSLIEQFLQTVALSTTEDGVHAITATINGRDKIITEVSIRRHLKLQDLKGLSSLPNAEIFEQLARMGFIQILLNKQQRLLLPHTRTYPTPTLTNKLFNNMRRASKGYSGVVTPLFDTMLVQPQGEAPSTSPSRITSSPSLSSHHTTSSTLTTPPSIKITHEAEETATMPHDLPPPGGHTPRSDKGRLKHDEFMELVTKLSGRVVAVEEDLKQTKKVTVLLLQRGCRDSGKNSADTKVLLEEETPTELIEDLGSGEKSTAGAEVSTASHDVSTAVAALVYIRRSASKAKDKGKAIMQEPKPLKKLKKRV